MFFAKLQNPVCFITAPHVVDPIYPGAVDEIVNLGDHWNEKYLKEHKEEIKSLTHNISQAFQKAYKQLAEAEALRQAEFARMKEGVEEEDLAGLAYDLVQDIFHSGLPQVRHFFATAVTPLGWTGYAQEISVQCPVRYLLKDGIADAASTLLRSIADAALERGHTMDIYHHTMQPSALEMLILPTLGVALADAECVGITELPTDRIIDISGFRQMLQEQPGSMEEEAQVDWRELVAEASLSIAEAKEIHNKLEAYYIQAMDFEAVDKIAKEIFGKIWSMAAQKEKKGLIGMV